MLCGPFHQPLGLFSGRGPTEDELGRLAEAHRAMADRAPELTLAIEPLNRFECYVLNTTAQAAAHVARGGPAELRLSLRHLPRQHRGARPGRRRSAATIGGDPPRPHLRERPRRARAPGTSTTPPRSARRSDAGYDGWFTVEAFGQALPDLAAATRIWRPLFDSEDEVVEAGARVIRDGWDELTRGRKAMSDDETRPHPARHGRRRQGRLHRRGAPHRGADRRRVRAGRRGALSSTPEKARASGAALGLAPDRTYDDFATMAKREARRKNGIEAVAIVTPNHMHAPAAREFLKRGIHVICDKPLTATLAEAKKLAQGRGRDRARSSSSPTTTPATR